MIEKIIYRILLVIIVTIYMYKKLKTNLNNFGYLKNHDMKCHGVFHIPIFSSKMYDNIDESIKFYIEVGDEKENNIFEVSKRKRNSKIFGKTDKMIVSYATIGDDIIGSLILYKWISLNVNFWVADFLNVKIGYRNKGVGNYLIRNVGHKLITRKEFGIFCTNRQLPLYKLFSIYWYKFKTQKTVSDNTQSICCLCYKQTDFESLFHYIPTCDWLKSNRSNFCNYLTFLFKNNLVIYESEDYVFGIEISKDVTKSKVLHVKWIWFKKEEKNYADILFLINDLAIRKDINFYSIPFNKKKLFHEIWEVEHCYIYQNKDSKINLPFISDDDKLGWYLGR